MTLKKILTSRVQQNHKNSAKIEFRQVNVELDVSSVRL